MVAHWYKDLYDLPKPIRADGLALHPENQPRFGKIWSRNELYSDDEDDDGQRLLPWAWTAESASTMVRILLFMPVQPTNPPLNISRRSKWVITLQDKSSGLIKNPGLLPVSLHHTHNNRLGHCASSTVTKLPLQDRRPNRRNVRGSIHNHTPSSWRKG